MKEQREKIYIVFLAVTIGIGFLGIIACREFNQLPIETSTHPQIFYNIQKNEIKIESIKLTSNPIQTIYGRLIEIQIRNLTDKSIAIVIEPGTVLRSDNQQLITNLVITAGETTTIEPYSTWTSTLEVFSINFKLYSPARDTNYSLGNLVGKDVGKLVRCFVKNRPDYTDPTTLQSTAVQTLNTPGEPPVYIIPRNNSQKVDEKKNYNLMPVQLAIWRLTDNMSYQQMLKAVAANPKLRGGEYSESVRLYQEMGPYVQELLNRCELEHYKF